MSGRRLSTRLADHQLQQAPLQRREHRAKLMAALQHLAVLADQRPHALAIVQRRALLDLDLGIFRGAAERPEGGGFRLEGDRIILPQAGGDHPAVKIDDAVELVGRAGAVVPEMRVGVSAAEGTGIGVGDEDEAALLGGFEDVVEGSGVFGGFR